MAPTVLYRYSTRDTVCRIHAPWSHHGHTRDTRLVVVRGGSHGGKYCKKYCTGVLHVGVTQTAQPRAASHGHGDATAMRSSAQRQRSRPLRRGYEATEGTEQSQTLSQRSTTPQNALTQNTPCPQPPNPHTSCMRCPKELAKECAKSIRDECVCVCVAPLGLGSRQASCSDRRAPRVAGLVSRLVVDSADPLTRPARAVRG